jgi:outer membrane protein assembly factor BamD
MSNPVRLTLKFVHERSTGFLRLAACCALLIAAFGCGRSPYDNPIANNSQQPDKILFDKAIENIERHRYELARITLQTLLNTYPDSEYIAKAKLAIADSWYREGTSTGLAQAEAEYKDFITFFPNMEEAAESQLKICQIHYNQLKKPDRDNINAVRADQECRQLLLRYPNTVFRQETEQLLRNAQEIIAEGEYRVGMFYVKKGSFRAGVNRLQSVTDHYPLFSGADEALWTLGENYEKLGDNFEDQQVAAYRKIVSDYPMSPWVDDAKEKLTAMERDTPETDRRRFELHKYNVENRVEPGRMGKFWGLFRGKPNLGIAAKMGDPAFTTLMPSTPPGIQAAAAAATGLTPTADVTVETISGPSALDTEPDARRNPPQPESGQQDEPE